MGSVEYARELTTEDLEFIYEHSPAGDYFTIDADGRGAQLHDVLTRKPLVPGAVPQAILQTPELAAGIEYLRTEAAGRATVRLVLGAHNSGDDLRAITQEHGNILQAPWIAMEMSWHSSYMQKTTLQPDKVTPALADHVKYPERRAFQTEELLWAHDNHKLIIPSDMSVDDESVLATELQHLWDDICQPLSHDAELTPVIRTATAMLAERAYQATRQWAIVAQLGNWLMRLDAVGRLPDGQFNIPLIIGSWHERSVERFKSLGVAAEAHRTPHALFDTPKYSRYGHLIMDAMYTGHADMNVLKMSLSD